LNEDEQLSLQLGNSVLWYQRSAEKRQSYYQAYHYAKLLLDSKLAARQSDKIAVVLDIDETVLDNSPSEAELILTATMYNDENWFKWIQMARAEALPGAKDFVDYAAQKGVEVFYISNREKFNMEPTLKNLIDLNFPFADTTHVLLKNGTSDKTARRSKISSDFEILVFVGDNLTDYSQLYANRDEGMGKQLVDDNKEELLANFVMLPNPMYGEWEKAIYDNNYELEVGKKLQKRKEVLIGY
jgi:5'-nucleotidase (lipoprotein e(P4) family)